MSRPEDQEPLLGNFTVVIPPFHTHDHDDHHHGHGHAHRGHNHEGRRSWRNLFRRSRVGQVPENHQENGHHYHHHHHQGEEDEHTISQRLSDLADEIKAVDGIDETANLIGQILPGLAGPIATATILTVFTPFVFLGIIGMKHEYEQAKDEMTDILAADLSVKGKLIAMAKLSAKHRQMLQEKLGLEVSETQEDTDQAAPRQAWMNVDSSLSDAKFLEKLYQAELLENRKMILKISKEFGWSGILGMSAMFAGMIPATTAAALEIAHEALDKSSNLASSIEVAAQISEKIAGSFFLVGQAAMIVYATSRGVAGVKGREMLQKSQDNFTDFSNLLQGEEFEKAKAAVLEVFKKQQYFLDKSSIQYAKLTVAGQVFMAAGTICGLTGAGIVASAPLFAVGAPLTIYPAIQRIIAQNQNQSFSGEKASKNKFVQDFSQAHQIVKMLEGRALRRDSVQDLQEAYKDIFLENAKELDFANQKLAELKIISLVRHLVNDKKYARKTPEQKFEILQQKLKIDKESQKLKSSNLEENVVAKAKEYFTQNRDEITEILESGKSAANKLLIKKSLQRICVLQNLPIQAQELPDLEDARQKELLAKLAVKHPERLGSQSELTIAKLTKEAVSVAKLSTKAARMQLVDNLVAVSCLDKLRQRLVEIENEQEQQPPASTSEPSALPQARGETATRQPAGVRLVPIIRRQSESVA